MRRLYYFVLLILCVMVVLLLPLALGGCTKTLRLEHTWPDGSVTKADYRNTGFNTSVQDFELRNGDTVVRLQKYNAESKSFEVAEKAIDLATQAAIAAGKVAAP